VSARAALLGALNRNAARRALAGVSDAVPSFIVVTPQLCHLAPLAAGNHGRRIQPVFIANGVDAGDVAWLRRLSPSVPVIRMRASLRGRAGSLIDHGVIVEHVARVTRAGLFCIQDADCFITDPDFWDSMALDPGTEYAVGPFVRHAEDGRPPFPETFLVGLNRRRMDALRTAYGITAEAVATPAGAAAELLREAGYPPGRYLEERKPYFDTLQQYWIASEYEGWKFRAVPGEGDVVHHVGGTSYLYRTFENLDHWDWWPLNVHYFHLRLLELPACARFRRLFSTLFEFHGSAASLLERYPDFAAGRRRAESDAILASTDAAGRYAGASS
jgi:hypothetical protein